jgi:hypothetical protein
MNCTFAWRGHNWVWYRTDVTYDYTEANISQPWRRRQYIPPKRTYLLTNPHAVTTKKKKEHLHRRRTSIEPNLHYRHQFPLRPIFATKLLLCIPSSTQASCIPTVSTAQQNITRNCCCHSNSPLLEPDSPKLLTQFPQMDHIQNQFNPIHTKLIF